MDIREEKSVISIQSGSWKAWVAPEVGMNLFSIQVDGDEILHVPADMESFKTTGTSRFGNPLQLPANRTAAGKFTFNGKEYQMPVNEIARNNTLHGSVRQSVFSVEEIKADSIKASLTNNVEIYPFPFKMEVTVCVDENGCSETVDLINTGDGDMPVAFGIHTVFKERDFFKCPIAMCRETNENAIPTGKLVELNEEHKSYIDGTYKGGTNIDTYFTAAGHTAYVGNVKFEVSENFDSWIIWNGDAKSSFIALEPQQGAPNCLNTGDGLIVLKKGEKETFTTRFELT